MIGDQIRKYRTQTGMTQQNLADMLFVTAQAVSRWEHGEVEPSLVTIKEMARIFNVTVDELLGNPITAREPEVIVKTEKEYVYKEPPQQILAVCEKCNRPIYKPEEIVRNTTGGGPIKTQTHTICRQCERKAKEEHKKFIANKAARRIKLSYFLGGLGLLGTLAIMIAVGAFAKPYLIAFGILVPIGIYTLISCLLFANNFIGDMFVSIAGFSIRMPGVIFSWNLDGIVWLLTIKLTMFLLGLFLSLFCFALATALGLMFSLFVYPSALIKIKNHPEECLFA